MYVRAIDAFYLSGDGERAAVVAEEVCRRFADDPDPGTAAVIRHGATYHRAIDSPISGLPLIEEALRLYEQALPGPSVTGMTETGGDSRPPANSGG